MPAKNDKCGKDWKLSARQLQQKQQEEEAAVHAVYETAAYHRLCTLYGTKLPVNAYFRNAMGNHFRVEAAPNGEAYPKQLTAGETVLPLGCVWLPIVPMGLPGMLYSHAPADPFEYEEVTVVDLGVQSFGLRQHPGTGLWWWVIQVKQAVLGVSSQAVLRYEPFESWGYDASRECFVSLHCGDGVWQHRGPGFLADESLLASLPNSGLLAGAPNGFQNEQFAAPPVVDQVDPLATQPPFDLDPTGEQAQPSSAAAAIPPPDLQATVSDDVVDQSLFDEVANTPLEDHAVIRLPSRTLTPPAEPKPQAQPEEALEWDSNVGGDFDSIMAMWPHGSEL